MTDAFDNFSIQPINYSEQIRQVITNAILEGKYKPGDKLPSEDKLVSRFNVSKTTIREALGLLIADGLIEKRRGAMGGSFVAKGNPDRILDVMITCYRLGGLSLEEILSYREAVEPAILEMACRNRTDEDLESMATNIRRSRAAQAAGKPDRETNIAFHRLIAKASKNRLFSVSLNAAIKISWEFTSRLAVPPETIDNDLARNEEFFDCIKAKNVDKARSLMTIHFENSHRIFLIKEKI